MEARKQSMKNIYLSDCLDYFYHFSEGELEERICFETRIVNYSFRWRITSNVYEKKIYIMYNYTFGGHYECIPGKSVTVQEFLKAVSPETLYYFDLRFIPILASFYDLRMDTNSSALEWMGYRLICEANILGDCHIPSIHHYIWLARVWTTACVN